MTVLDQLNTDDAEMLASEFEGEQQWQVWQNKNYRWLQDDHGLIHSALSISGGAGHSLPHINAMALAFAFAPQPLQRVFIAGIGGGDQLRQIARLAAAASVDVVDNSAVVVALQQQFFNQANNLAGLQVKQADVASAVASSGAEYELMLIDVLAGNASPECLWELDFYQNCQRCLSNEGVLAVNILPRSKSQLLALAVSLRQLFCKRMLFIPVPACDNVVLLLFKQSPQTISCEQNLRQAIATLESQLACDLGLDVDVLHRLNVCNADGALELWQLP